MRAYSQETRQRVLHAVDEGISRDQIIERFQVSRATIKRYLRQQRETGNVLPRPIPGRRPKKKAALQLGVQELLEAHPEARKPRVLPVVGGGVWRSGEPSFDEPGHPCAWLDAQQRKELRSERAIKEEVLSALKLFKQALEREWWGPI
jgi:transposase-like protein